MSSSHEPHTQAIPNQSHKSPQINPQQNYHQPPLIQTKTNNEIATQTNIKSNHNQQNNNNFILDDHQSNQQISNLSINQIDHNSKFHIDINNDVNKKQLQQNINSDHIKQIQINKQKIQSSQLSKPINNTLNNNQSNQQQHYKKQQQQKQILHTPPVSNFPISSQVIEKQPISNQQKYTSQQTKYQLTNQHQQQNSQLKQQDNQHNNPNNNLQTITYPPYPQTQQTLQNHNPSHPKNLNNQISQLQKHLTIQSNYNQNPQLTTLKTLSNNQQHPSQQNKLIQSNSQIGKSSPIKNQSILKRIQQLQSNVNSLKKQYYSSKLPPNQIKSSTQTISSSLHPQPISNLINKHIAPQSHIYDSRYQRNKSMIHSSNIYNLTIGQIINPVNHGQQKQILRKQVKQLRKKVLNYQQYNKDYHDNKVLSLQKQIKQPPSKIHPITKKSICGKLIRVSQLKSSKLRYSLSNINPQTFPQNPPPQSNHTPNDSIQQSSNQNQKNPSNIPQKIKNATFKINPDLDKQHNSSFGFRVKKIPNKLRYHQNNSNFLLQSNQQSSSLGNQNGIQQKQLTFVTKPKQSEIIKPSNFQQPQNQNKQLNKQWWQQPFIQPIKMPQLSSPPTAEDSQEDLLTLGRLTYLAFGINVDRSKKIKVKKYRNCVHFSLSDKPSILWYFDGKFYFGRWQATSSGQGQKSGLGFQLIPHKYLYYGQFKSDKRNGFGKIKIFLQDKQILYQGHWLDGNRSGQGKQLDQFNTKYWGQWKDNKKYGLGKLKFSDGSHYQGNFQRGVKTGFGTEYFDNGDKYQGHYLSNKFHGKGKYLWKNGSVYQGQFVNGMKSGHGNWKSTVQTQLRDQYQGQYANGKKNGYGIYKWADGSQYQGYFKDDVKQGQGTLRYKNGKVVKLLWDNGQPLKKVPNDQQKKHRQSKKSLQRPNNSDKLQKSSQKQKNKKLTLYLQYKQIDS